MIKSARYFKGALRKAIASSLKDRWIPRTRDPVFYGIQCPLCTLSKKVETSPPCQACPMPDKFYRRSECCESWYTWVCAHTPEEYKRAAQGLVEILRAIDVDPWVEGLVAKGILK